MIGALAEAVRGSERRVSPAALRALHAELVHALEPGESLDPEVAASVIEATDRLVNSLNSLAAVLAERARPNAGSAASQRGLLPSKDQADRDRFGWRHSE